MKKPGIKEGSMAAAAHNPSGAKFGGYWKGTDAGPPKPGQGVGGCEEAAEPKVVAPPPRNFVAKNAKMGGAGQHRDKKREQKYGQQKHKQRDLAVDEGLGNKFSAAMGKISRKMTESQLGVDLEDRVLHTIVKSHRHTLAEYSARDVIAAVRESVLLSDSREITVLANETLATLAQGTSSRYAVKENARLIVEYIKQKRSSTAIVEAAEFDQPLDSKALDLALAELCSMIAQGQREDPDYYGMVAACVIDPDGNQVAGINYATGTGHRVHAERAAVENYEEQYGSIPPGCVMVTTLSPCSNPMRDRSGDSCTDLMDQLGIDRVYCGYLDPTQDHHGENFTSVETENVGLRGLCRAIADTFLKGKFDASHTINEDLVETVDVDAIHAEAFREHLLSNPSLVENREDFQKMREFLNLHTTSAPKIGNSFIYASVQTLPVSNYINIAHFAKPHRLVKIENQVAYFDINGVIKRFPEKGKLGGDLLTHIYFFKSSQELNHFNTLLKLKFSDHKQSSKVLDEDYDPNGVPPGPEFKPTMPAGTVRVDVSDVYDWYKLGKHIPNLDRADSAEFGKGPPSTIVSFGSEEAEHKYIDALQKLGLATTDIDPVDPNQPKGMPRQKVDPTFNVSEGFDQPYSLTWEKSDYGDYDALARLPDGSPLSIMFNQEQGNNGEKIVQVEFYRNNSQEVTGEGDAQRVFATVLSAIQQYIKEQNPERLMFSASKQVEPDQNSESRAKLYDRLVQRYARAWGYRAVSTNNEDLVIYELTRLNPVKENFADGKKSGRKGLAKRVGVNCKQPVSKLRSIAANSSGERQRMAHWCANMKSGKKKTNEDEQDLQPGQYYVWKIYFDDGSSTRLKVTNGDFDAKSYYANKGRTVIKVEYDWTIHG